MKNIRLEKIKMNNIVCTNIECDIIKSKNANYIDINKLEITNLKITKRFIEIINTNSINIQNANILIKESNITNLIGDIYFELNQTSFILDTIMISKYESFNTKVLFIVLLFNSNISFYNSIFEDNR